MVIVDVALTAVSAVGVLLVAVLAAAGRVAARGRDLTGPHAPGLPLVAPRGTRFGEATAAARTRLRVVAGPAPAAPAGHRPARHHRHTAA